MNWLYKIDKLYITVNTKDSTPEAPNITFRSYRIPTAQLVFWNQVSRFS